MNFVQGRSNRLPLTGGEFTQPSISFDHLCNKPNGLHKKVRGHCTVQGSANKWSLGCWQRAPVSRGVQDAGITQPRYHSLADPCSYVNCREPPLPPSTFSHSFSSPFPHVSRHTCHVTVAFQIQPPYISLSLAAQDRKHSAQRGNMIQKEGFGTLWPAVRRISIKLCDTMS